MKKHKRSPLLGYKKQYRMDPYGRFTIRDLLPLWLQWIAPFLDWAIVPLRAKKANKILDIVLATMRDLPKTGENYFRSMIEAIKVKVTIIGKEHVPQEGACMHAFNHPGGPDVIVSQFVVHMLRLLDDAIIIANRLIYRIWWANYLAPLTKSKLSKKDLIAHNGDIKGQVRASFEEGYAVSFFPGTYMARKVINGTGYDRPWSKTFLKEARIAKTPVVIGAISNTHNSPSFYWLAKAREWLRISYPLESFFILKELALPWKKNITVTFGKPIQYESYNALLNEHKFDRVVNWMRLYCYELIKQPDLTFENYVESQLAIDTKV